MLLHHHLTGSDWTETLQSAVTWSPAADTAASWSLEAGDTALQPFLSSQILRNFGATSSE